MTLRPRLFVKTLWLSSVLLTSVAMSPGQAQEPASVYHTVIFWMKPGTPDSKVAEIIRNTKSFETLPMVEQVLVGTPIESERKVVDDSFTLAFTMTFKDEAALAAYNADANHKKISSQVTLPHVMRGVIYDYKSQ
ncbi:MAG: Dabb family protein [Rhodobiaceae bacterium]|jgi:hypothetical protein|nr:Dabb family protein [Rhodobiaceae bacterium]MBT7641399.1 Dabb family protein [Rhodobiaceae bacterium]